MHRWFLYRLDAGEGAIDLVGAESSEFGAWRWMSMSRLAAEAVPFRQPVYRELAAYFAGALAE